MTFDISRGCREFLILVFLKKNLSVKNDYFLIVQCKTFEHSRCYTEICYMNMFYHAHLLNSNTLE